MEGRVDGAVIAAVVVVVGYAVLRLSPVMFPVYWPLTLVSYLPLLVVAVGLLALARLERGPGLLIIAALYTAAAVLATTYNVENLAFRLGWDPFVAHPAQARFTSLPSLLLPGVILFVGGGIAGLRAAFGRRAR